MPLSRSPKWNSAKVWAVFNWGNFNNVFRTRRDALEHVRTEFAYYRDNRPGGNKTWKDLYEIHKVRVVPR